MKPLQDYFPDAQTIVATEPEVLAGWLLAHLNERGEDRISRHNFSMEVDRAYGTNNVYGKNPAVTNAVLEAWSWLQREGFLIEDGTQADRYFLSRRAKRVKTRDDLDAFRRANILPKEFLHPVVASKVWNSFLQADYDTAVFQAFKEVEVAVRQAGGFPPTDLGTDLMRKAFHKDKGPLTTTTDPVAERDAISALFAGAIGSYKNPSSHRHVSIDAHEAAEMIILASHLLGIIDARTPAPHQTPERKK
jgi:uncharacterized protein (TIGR02391 family)